MSHVISIKLSPSSSTSSSKHVTSPPLSSHNLLPLPNGIAPPADGGDSQHSGMFCYLCTPGTTLFWQRTRSTTKSDETEKPTTTTTTTTRWLGGRIQNWKEMLFKVSDFASILCVIDCTVLPVVTLLFPLLGLASSASTSELLHDVGHAVARYFVLPVGTLTTALNFWAKGSSKDKDDMDRKATTRLAQIGLFLLGVVGCLLVALANSGDLHQHHHHHHHHSDHLHHDHHQLLTILSSFQHGMGHRVTNLVGCACLLTSNYLSRRLSAHHHNCCNHNH